MSFWGIRVVGRLVAIILLLTATAAADAGDVPVPLQGAIFAKVLKYDQTLRQRGGKQKVVILSDDTSAADARKLSRSFEQLKADVAITTVAGLRSALEGASALYVFSHLWTPGVGNLCDQYKVLSLSGSESDAQGGRVSVALGIAKGKPQIVVHLPKSKAEGHHLSSRLLKLARVVR